MLTRRAALTGALALAACGRRPAAAPPPRMESDIRVIPPNFGESHPVDWPGRTPSQYAVHGIDVSRWQGDIDWRRARAAGVNFAFLKATEGGDRTDPRFLDYTRGATAAGIVTGPYHFYYFCRPAHEQAAWFIQNVPKMPGALPPVVDLEWNHLSPTCTLRPPAAEVQAEIGRFVGILAAHYGRRPLIYTTRDFWAETGIEAIGGERWLRAVTMHPDEAYNDALWHFWQYSGTGIVDGVTGNCDLNCFSGSAQSWRAWLAARRQPG
ncbi:glycoside hydrolase family 25 protein [Wenxinia marina]|nr:GH25 family lysozyme [Wenxinia marina]GGL68393.1 glycoside hydrolase [Wenxinia marina]